ncbi:hypothetical protein DFH08DRAFT_340168 [Mycena albidolilacea]|uniref:Uncharacterized protein n=1 Tax=Mycena albidolilacea TaxID=1033008 RepID=A0AAD6ZKH5_9AGAR|nr:hypothetical protein DFH08DRAFT_340168 [Mycena albidolilacea]
MYTRRDIKQTLLLQVHDGLHYWRYRSFIHSSSFTFSRPPTPDRLAPRFGSLPDSVSVPRSWRVNPRLSHVHCPTSVASPTPMLFLPPPRIIPTFRLDSTRFVCSAHDRRPSIARAILSLPPTYISSTFSWACIRIQFIHLRISLFPCSPFLFYVLRFVIPFHPVPLRSLGSMSALLLLSPAYTHRYTTHTHIYYTHGGIRLAGCLQYAPARLLEDVGGEGVGSAMCR